MSSKARTPVETVTIAARARIVPILAALAGRLLAWRWAAAIGGARAGLLAMVALLFYPEYLGHGRYVTFDVPTLASCGAISLAAWGWWRRPGAKAGAAFAGCSAVLALVKLHKQIAHKGAVVKLTTLYDWKYDEIVGAAAKALADARELARESGTALATLTPTVAFEDVRAKERARRERMRAS